MKSKLNHLAIAVTVVLTVLAIGGYAPPLIAQDVVLEEIVVTGQRREESLHDVSLSVSVFDAESLEKSNISEARDYLVMSPNIGFTEDGQSGSRSISVSIRGVSSIALDTVAIPSSIGYYVDELNIATTASGNVNPQLQDMQRIEVLRGPQGTYFGRNALGGAINITTKKPDEKFYAEGSVSTGSFKTSGAEGVVNLPVSDTFMLRFAGGYEESNGPVENVNPQSDNDTKFQTFRGAARWLAADNFTVDFSVSHTNENEGGDIAVGSGITDLDTQSIFADFTADDLLGFYPQNDSQVNHNLKEENDGEVTIYNLRLSWEFDRFAIKSITGLVDSKFERVFDQDNISADIINRFNKADAESFSQELRIQSAGESIRLDWTAGVYYAKDDITRFNSIQFGVDRTYTDPTTGVVTNLPLPPVPAGFRINENNFGFKTTSTAVFGEATFHISDVWSVTGGARFTRDEVVNRAFNVVAFEGAVDNIQGAKNFTNISPKAGVRFVPNDNFTVYATFSQGYKPGGVDHNDGIATSFDEENLTSWEAGFKSKLAGQRIRLSGAVFMLDWKDLQVQTNFLKDPADISSAVSKTLNAAEASSSGVELEFLWLLSNSFTWGVNLGFIDASYGNFPNVDLPGSNKANLTGLDLPKTPEWTLSTTLDYSTTPGSGDLEIYGRIEWNYRSSVKGDLEGVAAQQLNLPDFPYNIPSYSAANLRFGIRTELWRVNVFVENLLKKDYYTGTSDNFGLAGIRLRPHPRVFGASFTVMTSDG